MTKRARSITPPSDPDQDCAQTAHKRRRVELPIPVPVPRRTRNISVGDLRQILSIFIFDIPWMEQGERAVDEVESILFSGDAPSLSEKERRRAIFVQVHRHLKQFLFLHGFTTFSLAWQNKAPHMRIAPENGTDPLPLPHWLQKPYIRIVDSNSFAYVAENDVDLSELSASDRKLRSGDRVIDHSGTVQGSGTVGAFMWSGEDLYAITAGHVVNDAAGDTFEIQHRLSGARIRAKHLICLHPNLDNEWTREVSILKVADAEKGKINASLPRINLHKYCPQGPRKHFQRASKGNQRLDHIEERIGETGGITVFKEGYKTGKTFGLLKQTYENMSTAWLYFSRGMMRSTPDEELKLDHLGITVDQLHDNDSHHWVGVVCWIDEASPFATHGDSGSLIYAVEDSQTIPLGIHMGRSQASIKPTSVFLGLEAFWTEGRYHGLELRFE